MAFLRHLIPIRCPCQIGFVICKEDECMATILKSAWIDIFFVLAMIGLFFAGMRGFQGFFPFALGLALLYLLLMIFRAFKKKRSS